MSVLAQGILGLGAFWSFACWQVSRTSGADAAGTWGTTYGKNKL